MIVGGRGEVRRALYMAALVPLDTTRSWRFCQRLLAAGKRKKVALVACMRKILVIINAVVKSARPWNPSLHVA